MAAGLSESLGWPRPSKLSSIASSPLQPLNALDRLLATCCSRGLETKSQGGRGAQTLAAAHALADDLVSAELAYAALAADKTVPALYQQAAQLLAVMNAPAGSDVGALQDSLSSLVEGGPWQPLALELSAALDIQNGDNAAAIAKLETLINLVETPNELRQRASRLVQVLNS